MSDVIPPPPDSPPPAMGGDGTDGDTLVLARYAERAYLDYAISTVRSRALPDVCDGQKPVQRRILFAMHDMGLGPGARAVKAARVVGDVLGKYHPHGDNAAYDALVRMAQDFSLRYPLIDGQGNFGSRDGDGAAAMRYTEARLTNYARLLLDEIGMGTVDFIPNYDGSGTEPALLPARLPVVLLNGASGIAVALATEIPSHNLREVASAAALLVQDPDTTLEQILEVLPGPDFPGGGQLISAPADIAEMYRTGRGSFKLRARHHFEDLARGQWQLVIDELPHGVSTRSVMEEIEELSNPRVRAGRKAHTPEQQNLRQQVLAVIDTVRDESGKDAAIRLVIEPRTGKVPRDQLLQTLLAHTSLESGVPINLVMIGIDGSPRQKSLRDILVEWSEYRVRTVRRRTAHRLEKVLDRIHILEGRQAVLLNIEAVIRIIRESDEPGAALREHFGLSERQAEDILEIRLRQLARLEGIRIEKELGELRTEQGGLERLLGSERILRNAIVREIRADAERYGDDRRTLIEAAARTTLEVQVPQEPVTVVVSELGWVRARAGHGHDPAQFTFKAGDGFYGAWPVLTTDTFYMLADNGRVCTVPVSALPSGRGDGVPVSTLADLEGGARFVHFFSAPAQSAVLVATERGFGVLSQAIDWHSRMKAGKSFLTLEPGDRPLKPVVFDVAWAQAAGFPVESLAGQVAATGARGAAASAVAAGRTAAALRGQTARAVELSPQVICLTGGDRPRVLAFALSELKWLRKGGKGVVLMALSDGEALAQTLVCLDRVQVRGLGRQERALERLVGPTEMAQWQGRRAHRGRLLEPRWKDPVLVIPTATES